MLFAPFLIFYGLFFFLLLAFVFALVTVGFINYAFHEIGLTPNMAFAALLLSFLGSYVNIPVWRLGGSAPLDYAFAHSFGVRYPIPRRYAGGSTTVAVNVGGAVVPVVLSAYLLLREPGLFLPAVAATTIVALVVHRLARPVPGLGIATPMFVPPLVAALAGYFLGAPHYADVLAYVSGVMGTLIGADLANLHKLGDLGAPVASIGGAGTFDGIFLSGIVAALLA
ncbi:MAG: DUF1614 domain-containing protein [Deltaproteobacteria bacterium]|jgi:uncharacterized membrane protein|nr:DUF1614 domain-containing protein [Deltaproteobacteria bacterium]